MSATTKKMVMAAGLSAVILGGTSVSPGQTGKYSSAERNPWLVVPALPESNTADKVDTSLMGTDRSEHSGTSGRLLMQSFRLPATATRG